MHAELVAFREYSENSQHNINIITSQTNEYVRKICERFTSRG